MRHLDLFSGIGGFALAAQRVWGKDHEIVAFCDIDPFCQAVLKKNFKGVYVHGDIRTLSVERLIADTPGKRCGEKGKGIGRSTERIAGNHRVATNAHDRRSPVGEKQTAGDKQCHIDLLTGGFPCQPFSHAGKRRGKSDDRFLWPEMLRVIKEFQPTWIIGENVAGLASMAQPEGEVDMEGESDTGEPNDDQLRADGILWGIISDIENLGYEVQPLVIPACAVNAPHRRDRIWIVAHAIGCEHKTTVKKVNGKTHEVSPENRKTRGRPREFSGTVGLGEQGATDRLQNNRTISSRTGHAPNSGNEGLQGREQRSALGKGPRSSRPVAERPGNGWGEPWPQVATRLCVVDDGLSRRLVRLPDNRSVFSAGQQPPVKPPTITGAHWRQEALKAAGNAIVPAVAEEIMRAIKTVGLT